MTATPGQCTHDRHYPSRIPVREDEECRVCELLAEPRTIVIDEAEENIEEDPEAPGTPAYSRDLALRAWRGREEEANGWVFECTYREAVAVGEPGVFEMTAGNTADIADRTIIVNADYHQEFIERVLAHRRPRGIIRRHKEGAQVIDVIRDPEVFRAIGHTSREWEETIARIRHWGQRIHVSREGCVVTEVAEPIGLDPPAGVRDLLDCLTNVVGAASSISPNDLVSVSYTFDSIDPV